MRFAPAITARSMTLVAALAARDAEAGNKNTGDRRGRGRALAGAAAKDAAYNVRIRMSGMPQPAEAAELVAKDKRLIEEAERNVSHATAAVEAVIGG